MKQRMTLPAAAFESTSVPEGRGTSAGSEALCAKAFFEQGDGFAAKRNLGTGKPPR